MIPDEMVASLEDFLRADEDGELAREIIAALERLQLRLDAEGQKMHLRSTFKAIDAARQAVQAGMLAMVLYGVGEQQAAIPKT
ncbi:MAG: hypothetical protein RL404_1317 [Pseudomonadota bacterium]|jgi:hypothetical protein